MVTNLEDIKNRAAVIRDETEKKKNTANRVGSTIVDLVDLLEYENSLVPTSSLSLFRIYKTRGLVVVIGNPEVFAAANEQSPIKLKVFRQQGGRIGDFHRANPFEFDLHEVDISTNKKNGYTFYRYVVNLRDYIPVRSKFLGIVKYFNDIRKEGFFIGRSINPAKKKGKMGLGTLPPQDKNNFTLWAALWQNGKVISNYVRIKAFYVGDNQTCTIDNIIVR